MNSIYFSVGFAIILALVAALVGPFFIDWTAYRAEFESRAALILGHPVKVMGTADASLLPYPRLAFTNVVIGPDEANPLMTVDRFDLEVELFPLLSGEVVVTQMRLEKPEVTVRIAGDGRFEWLAAASSAPVDPAHVVLNQVSISNGAVRLFDERRPAPLEVTGINAELDARSLMGPFRFDGSAIVEGEPVTIKASTGTGSEAGKTVLKSVIIPASRPLSITLDGEISSKDSQPTWAGKASIQRVIAEGVTDVLPWQVAANIDVDSKRLLMKELEFQYGPEDRPFSITGAATIDYTTDPQFNAVLSARQIDLDRTLGSGPDKPVAFSGVLSAVRQTLSTLPRPAIPGSIGFDIPGVVVGGGIVSNLQLDVSLSDAGWTIQTLQADMPGKTSIAATGELTTVDDVSFLGQIAISSDQPSAFVSWWDPDTQRPPLAPFQSRADIAVGDSGLTLDQIEAEINGAKVSGNVVYVAETPDNSAAVSLDLSADSFNLADAQAISSLVDTGAAGADIRVKLKADAVTAGTANAGKIDIAAALTAGSLDIERFSIGDLAGATIAAKGSIRDIGTTPDGAITLSFEADDLTPLAELVNGMAVQSAVAEHLRAAAPALGPMSASATIEATAGTDRTALNVNLDGTAAGSTIAGRLAFGGRVDRWQEGDVDFSLNLSGPDGGLLMRQMGLDVSDDLARTGAGSVSLTAMGKAAHGLDSLLEASLGETSLSSRGAITVTDHVAARLETEVKSPDIGPLVALTGNPISMIMASLPADLSFLTEVDSAKVAISNIGGEVNGAPVTGALAVDFATPVPTLTGALDLAFIDVEGLGDLALGAGATSFPIIETGSPWPEAPFGSAALDGLNAKLALSFDKADLGAGLTADALSLELNASAAAISFDAIKGNLAGGALSGAVVIKKDLEGTAAVTASLKLVDVPTESFVWRRNDQPVVTGKLSTDLQFDTTGRTFAGLVAGMTGGGAFNVTGGKILSMNPTAFSAVDRAFSGDRPLTDEAVVALFTDMVDAGNLEFDRIEGTFSLSAGVLRAPSISVASASAETTGSATIDLPKLTLESDWNFSALADGASSIESAPQVAILFRGDLDAPERRIDATAFSSYLNIRSVERETERVLVMQADTLERDMLVRQIQREKEAIDRRLKAEEEARRRAEIEAAERAAAAANGAAAPGDGTAATEPARDTTPAQPDGADFIDSISNLIDANRDPADGTAPATDALPPLGEPVVIDPAPPVANSVRRIKPADPAPANDNDNFLPGVNVGP